MPGREQGGAGECGRGEQKNSLYAGDFQIPFRNLSLFMMSLCQCDLEDTEKKDGHISLRILLRFEVES